VKFVQFTLAGKPMAKGRVRFTQKGHAYTPEKTVAYEGQLAFAAQTAMNGRLPADGPVVVTLIVSMPIPASWAKKKRDQAERGFIHPVTKPDLDNFAKMLDALNHIVWNDDSQIIDLRVIKTYSLTPQMTVAVDLADAKYYVSRRLDFDD
jgi:Holliday junction resolvase RusA-like endonuclease